MKTRSAGHVVALSGHAVVPFKDEADPMPLLNSSRVPTQGLLETPAGTESVLVPLLKFLAVVAIGFLTLSMFWAIDHYWSVIQPWIPDWKWFNEIRPPLQSLPK